MNRPLRYSHNSMPKGFTVLELIVALTLGLVLLSAIWTMFRLFLRHEEIETAQVEKLQIVSSLHQHLSQELLNLFPAGNTGPETAPPTLPKINFPIPGGTPPVFPFPLPNQLGGIAAEELSVPSNQIQEPALNFSASSLVGNATRLELTVFASVDDNEIDDQPSDPRSSSALRTQDKPPRAPTKKITYEFSAPKDGFDPLENVPLNDDLAIDEVDEDPESTFSRVGLWRRESVASTSASSRQAGNSNLESRDLDFELPSVNQPLARKSTQRDNLESLGSQGNSQVEEFAPEIIDLQFDYFDGRKWQSNWDSSKGNRLPVLVRVRFAVETRTTLRERKLEERTEKAFSKSRQIDQDEELDAPLTQDSKRFGASEPLDPNWDYQFLIFVSPPTKSSTAASIQSTENRIKNSGRSNNRARGAGGANR